MSLAEFEFPASVLADRRGEAHLAENEPARALREILANASMAPIAQTGWRVISEKETEVAFAAPALHEGWDVVVVASDPTGRWELRSGAYVQQPTITKAERGAGLHLEWDEATMSFHRGSHPQLRLLLVNDRADDWVDDRGEYWGFAKIIDPRTDEPFPNSGVYIAGVGREYRIPHGESASLPVAIATKASEFLPPGTYSIDASINSLALTAPRGELHVYESQDLPFHADDDDPYLLFDLVQLVNAAVIDAEPLGDPSRSETLKAFRDRLLGAGDRLIESTQIDDLVRGLDARIAGEPLPGLAPGGDVDPQGMDSRDRLMHEFIVQLRTLGYPFGG